jgi:hypothetical protein
MIFFIHGTQTRAKFGGRTSGLQWRGKTVNRGTGWRGGQCRRARGKRDVYDVYLVAVSLND